MADYPQIKDEPILSPVQVNSKAQGFEDFAKTLGSIATSSEEEAEKIADEASNAGLMQSAAQLQTVKTDAQIRMIENPDQADKVSQQTSGLLDSLGKNAVVNKTDRLRLKSMINTDWNDLRLKAADVTHSQNVKDVANNFWDNYPEVKKSIDDAVTSGNLKKAQELEEALHETARSAAHLGAISPEQLGNISKSISTTYDRASDMATMMGNPDASAQDFHTVMASPFNKGTFENINYPVNGHTQWMSNHLNYDRTMSGQYAALYSDGNVNWGVVLNSSAADFNDFKMQVAGVNEAKGAIHSGMPFSQIENRAKALEAKPKLTPMETGFTKYVKGFRNELENGDGYLRMMSQTTMGARFTQDYYQQKVSIDNAFIRTPDEKFQAQRDNENNYIGNMIALGQSQHVDPSLIRPIPQQTVSSVKSAFIKDAPVSEAISQIAYIKPQYRAYLASAMEKDNQKVSVFLAGATIGKADTTFQAQLLEANQNRDYSALLKSEKDDTKTADIWNDISSDRSITQLNKYFAKLPGGDSINDGFKASAVNYVLYRAAKEGDININGKSQYINDFIQNVNKGFDIQTGARYLFNNADLGLRNVDFDYISDYAISQAYRNIHQGRTEADFQSYIDLNPLHATNTPDGRIVVIDKSGHAAVDVHGHEAFDQPYTSNMLHAAHENAESIQKDMSQYFSFGENAKRAFRGGVKINTKASLADQAKAQEEDESIYQPPRNHQKPSLVLKQDNRSLYEKSKTLEQEGT